MVFFFCLGPHDAGLFVLGRAYKFALPRYCKQLAVPLAVSMASCGRCFFNKKIASALAMNILLKHDSEPRTVD